MAQLTTELLASLLRSRMDLIDPSIEIVTGRVPDMPDRVVTVVRGSGSGSTMGGVFEKVDYTLECRGQGSDLGDAEKVANTVDDIIMDYFNSIMYEGVYILVADRTGGGPQQLKINDPQSRYSFACTYSIESGMD